MSLRLLVNLRFSIASKIEKLEFSISFNPISNEGILLSRVPLINIFFAIQVKKMRGEIYLALGLLAAAGIFKSLQSVFEVGAIALIDTLIITGICIITFYIKAKAFPNFGFSGIKKGEDGHYQF